MRAYRIGNRRKNHPKKDGICSLCADAFAANSAIRNNGKNSKENVPNIAADSFPAEWGEILLIEYFNYYSFVFSDPPQLLAAHHF
jgi:hypothetical protein